MLHESLEPLRELYDLALLDLDGVVYIGPNAVAGAAGHLEAARTAGLRLAYVTNNAARPPSVVADHLRDLGIPARAEDVVTSAQAAARLVSGQVPAGSNVYVIGGAGLFEALTAQGLVGVSSLADEPVAVVSGFAMDLEWQRVVDGAILVKRGLPWVASNLDLTVPTAHGPGPGNGVLVEAVARYADRRPVVAGKPQRSLFDETITRVGGQHPLVVGDRLDTDIEGAVSAGFDSLLVMTGVTGLVELVAAQPRMRPSYISADLGGLASAHPLPAEDGASTGSGAPSRRLGGWVAEVVDGALVLHGEGGLDDWWRVVAEVSWEHLDRYATPVDVASVNPPVR